MLFSQFLALKGGCLNGEYKLLPNLNKRAGDCAPYRKKFYDTATWGE